MAPTKRLNPGAIAPDFTAHTYEDKVITLKTFRGTAVWLAFFRFASCPFCNVRIHEMGEQQLRLGSNKLQIIAVFQSPKEKIVQAALPNKIGYPLVADPDQKLYTLYGVESSMMGFAHLSTMTTLAKAAQLKLISATPPDGPVSRIPADFLVNADGRIQDAFYGDGVADHIPLDRVMRFIA